MADKDMQTQINEINQKLDLVLQYVDQQRLKTDEVQDLVSDITMIGNDAFKATVEELEHANIEIDPDLIKQMFFRLLKNLGNINQVIELMESTTDLLKDVKPITQDLIINFIYKVEELEQKGYLEFIKESTKIIDNVIKHLGTEDVGDLANNIVTILATIKNLTQPEMMTAMNNAVMVYKNMDYENIPEYSMWKAFREMNTPEMKKGIGFIITFLKNVSKSENK